MRKILTLITLAAALICASAWAGNRDVLDCSIQVQYSMNGQLRYQLDRDFQLSEAVPYREDLSTATRFGELSASLAFDNGVPVVKVFFDRDISVFSYVSFDADMAMHNLSDGQSQTGGYSFVTSQLNGTSGHHRTDYVLNCGKSGN